MEKEHPAYKFDDLEPSEPKTKEDWEEVKEKEGVPTTHKEAMERLMKHAYSVGDTKAHAIAYEEFKKEENSEIIHKLDQLLAQNSDEEVSVFLSTISGASYVPGLIERIRAVSEKWPQQKDIAIKYNNILRETVSLKRRGEDTEEWQKKEIKKREEIIEENKKELDILSKIIDDKEPLIIVAYDSKVIGRKPIGEKWDDYGTADWRAYDVTEYEYTPKENSISVVKKHNVMDDEDFDYNYGYRSGYRDKAMNQITDAADNKNHKETIIRFPVPLNIPTLAKGNKIDHLVPKNEEDIKRKIKDCIETKKEDLKKEEYKLNEKKEDLKKHELELEKLGLELAALLKE